MKTGKCPKCGGTDILEIKDKTWRRAISGKTVFTIIYCSSYVCSQCGFIEEYVAEEDLSDLRRRHEK